MSQISKRCNNTDIKLKSRGGLWIDPEFEGDFLLFGGATPRSMKTHIVSRISQKMKGGDYEEVGLYLDLLNECEEEGHEVLREEYKVKAENISLVTDAACTSVAACAAASVAAFFSSFAAAAICSNFSAASRAVTS